MVGARWCSIEGAILGTSVFPDGVPVMRDLRTVLTAEDVEAIADYLNSFEKITGQERYIAACAGCHGMDAAGGRVGESVKGEKAKDILEAIREESPMEYLSCMPASDIKEIGKYLQSLGKGKGRGGDDDHDDDDRVRHDRRKRRR